MKKFSILMSTVFALAFTACEDNEDIFVVDPNAGGFDITSGIQSSYILSFDAKDNLAERFLWAAADFTTPTAVNYTVEADADADFSSPTAIGSTSERELAITVEQMNNISGAQGLAPFAPGVLNVRVIASVSGVDNIISSVKMLNITPYTTEAPKLWVPGGYANASGYGNDWDPTDASTPTLGAVEFGSTDFEGFVNMDVASPEFKFTPNADWSADFGDNGSDGILDAGGANLTVPGAGYYLLKANTDPDGNGDSSDATWSAEATSWGIIGAATPTGWGSDTDMTYNASTQKWEITIMLGNDEFKFRSNDDWGTNLGADDNGDGSMNFGGGNLSTGAAGMYKVELDLSNPRQYEYTLTVI